MRTVAAPTTAACEGANNERRQRFASDGGFSGRGPRRRCAALVRRGARRATRRRRVVRIGRGRARLVPHRTGRRERASASNAGRASSVSTLAREIGFFVIGNARTFLRPSREATGATAFLAATLTGALTATAEPRKVEVMAAILMCVVTCIRGYGSDAMRGSDARQERELETGIQPILTPCCDWLTKPPLRKLFDGESRFENPEKTSSRPLLLKFPLGVFDRLASDFSHTVIRRFVEEGGTTRERPRLERAHPARATAEAPNSGRAPRARVDVGAISRTDDARGRRPRGAGR